MIKTVRFITCLHRAWENKTRTLDRQLTNKTMSSSSLLLQRFISLPFFLKLFLQPNQNTYHLVLFYLCYNSHCSFSQECLPLCVQALHSSSNPNLLRSFALFFQGKVSSSSLNFHRTSSVALLWHSLIHLNNYFVHLYSTRSHLRAESEPKLSLCSSKYFVHLSVKRMA